jgi:starch phosphorylase
MKAAANGSLNLSVLDGWWGEGFNGHNGWGFGDDNQTDEIDAQSLYDLLEHEVSVLYYDRDETGIPLGWVEMMKEAIASIAPEFSAHRMVSQYTDWIYTSGG